MCCPVADSRLLDAPVVTAVLPCQLTDRRAPPVWDDSVQWAGRPVGGARRPRRVTEPPGITCLIGPPASAHRVLATSESFLWRHPARLLLPGLPLRFSPSLPSIFSPPSFLLYFPPPSSSPPLSFPVLTSLLYYFHFRFSFRAPFELSKGARYFEFVPYFSQSHNPRKGNGGNRRPERPWPLQDAIRCRSRFMHYAATAEAF